MFSRPFIFVNIAASVDGKISDESRKRLRISGKEDLLRVDRLRAFSDAIMVGVGTVLSDNPSLTIKQEVLKAERMRNGKPANPMRVVVDSRLRTPPNARVLDGEAETLIATTELSEERRRGFGKAKIEIFGREKVDLSRLCRFLYEVGVERLMVEGGGTLINSMLKEKLVDELNVYFGNMVVGGRNSPTIVDGTSFDPPVKLELLNFQKLGKGLFTRWKVVYE